MAHFDQQRAEFNSKIERLQVDNVEKDKQIATLQHRLERITEDLDKKKNEVDGIKLGNEKEKKLYQDKNETLKKKAAELQDELMQ